MPGTYGVRLFFYDKIFSLFHPLVSLSVQLDKIEETRTDGMVKKMRMSDKGMNVHASEGRIFGVDFHDIIQKEQQSSAYELASEFGLTLGDVKKLKKHLERS
jgi:hypothetical protein